MPIPVFFHNLKGYDGHLLMQAMARARGEIKCIPTNTEKYISYTLGNLRFVDSVNFLQNYHWLKSFYFATVLCSFLQGIKHSPSLFGGIKCLSRFQT